MYSYYLIFAIIFILLVLLQELSLPIYKAFGFCMLTYAVTNLFIRKCGLNLL